MAEAFREETKQSVGALLPILILGDVFAIAYYRRHAKWNRLWVLLPYVVVGMVPGFLVLDRFESDALRLLLGCTILTLLTLHVLSRRFGWGHLPERKWFVPVTGILAGFGTAVGNSAGPVMSIYLVGSRLDKHEFLGTAAWFFFIVNVGKLLPFVLLGIIPSTTLHFDLLLAPVVVIGALVGVFLLKRIPQAIFDTFVLALAGLAGLWLILD